MASERFDPPPPPVGSPRGLRPPQADGATPRDDVQGLDRVLRRVTGALLHVHLWLRGQGGGVRRCGREREGASPPPGC